jgi:hypothetical protein
MSRNPAFDQLLQELCDAVSQPTEAYGITLPSVYQDLAQSLTQDMLRTYEAKDQDYASNGKPMGNLRDSEHLGIPAWKAVLLRMSDKKQRITSFINRGRFEVEDEKVTDTLIDLANYALLGLILFREIYEDYQHKQSHELMNWPQLKTAITEADSHFFNIATCALRSKILHELNRNEESTAQPWDGENWTNLLTSFEQVASFARSVH